MRLPPTFETRLIKSRVLTPTVRELTFERCDGEKFEFEAGQWINLALPLPSGEIKRAYSIASGPMQSPRFELAVTLVDGGPGSTYLHNLATGSVVQATGPQGFFTRPLDKTGPSLFVATGTGLTPLRSMMLAALREEHGLPLWLILGVRTEEDLLYRDELLELAKNHPEVRVELTLSRPHEGWTGRRGYVQTHVRELYDGLVALERGRPHVYICGLQKMVGGVRDLLKKEMNLPRELVHSERYD
jgi:CDP-4-dehydro-6-deoxyglucose reductase